MKTRSYIQISWIDHRFVIALQLHKILVHQRLPGVPTAHTACGNLREKYYASGWIVVVHGRLGAGTARSDVLNIKTLYLLYLIG